MSEDRRPPPLATHWSEALCNALVLGLALWTLIANATVFLGGNFSQLRVAEAVGFGILALWAIRRGRVRAEAGDEITREPPAALEPHTPRLIWRTTLAIAAAAIVAGYAWTENTTTLWLGALALSAVAVVSDLRRPPQWCLASSGRRLDAALLILCVVCAVLTLVAHHPDADDAFYLNLAVSAVDQPARPLLASDTLHGIPDIPLALPVYRVHSFELLAATVATILGRPVLDIAHLLFPAVAAFFVPLGLARVFRILTPTRWLWSVALALAFLVGAGESAHSIGNLAFTRLHQGKIVLITLALPLVIAHALEFKRSPTLRSWLLLAAAQIAAVGLSATSLWLAPAIAWLALLSATPLGSGSGRRELRTLILGAGASAYVIALAMGLRGATEATFREAVIQLPSVGMPSHILAREALRYVIWVSPMAFATLLVILAAWSGATSTLLRRFAAVFLLGFTLCFWNPYTAAWIATHVTGAPTYWRVFWVLPLPLIVGATLSAPVDLLRRHSALGAAICIVLGALLLAVPQQTSLAPANQVTLGRPGWKLPADPLRIAQETVRLAPAGSLVLVPLDVSLWLPALHQHPTPLVVRKQYFPLLEPVLGEEELIRRARLSRMVTGLVIPAHPDALLADAIDTYPLELVCLVPEVANDPEIRRALERSPLERVDAGVACEIWARSGGPRGSTSDSPIENGDDVSS